MKQHGTARINEEETVVPPPPQENSITPGLCAQGAMVAARRSSARRQWTYRKLGCSTGHLVRCRRLATPDVVFAGRCRRYGIVPEGTGRICRKSSRCTLHMIVCRRGVEAITEAGRTDARGATVVHTYIVLHADTDMHPPSSPRSCIHQTVASYQQSQY
eukprot:gene1798-biopygen322